MATQKERQLLIELAKKVAHYASLPIQQERAQLWRDHNALRPTRAPVEVSPEDGWVELVTPESLQCESPLLRDWETQLRKKLFYAEHINDDTPVTDYLNVAWVVDRGNYGLQEHFTHSDTARGAFAWEPVIKTEADVDKLKFNEIKIDREQTDRNEQLAREIFGDILTVRRHSWMWWSPFLTGRLVYFRGLEQTMMDMYDNPRLLHRIMSFLRDAFLREMDFAEREGILWANWTPDEIVGSGGLGCSDELPASDFSGTVRLKDMWGLGESQEFVGVGPEMFDEFVLQYLLPVLEKFGLNCFGCCEPLDKKFDLVLSKVPRLRRVSVSPWCNREIARDKLADKYIYSWKPNPVLICSPTVHWDQCELAVRETLEIARDCRVEIIMKDTHTFAKDPTRAGKWAGLAKRISEEMA